MRNRTQKLARLAILISFAMILSYLESRIPTFVAIPGVKVGLANIAVFFALYRLGTKEAITISLVRVFLISMLFGNPVSLVYSLMGALLSLSGMLLLKKWTPLSAVTVSVSGGILHNVGQIVAASVLLDTNVVIYYLPFLILSGTIAGTVIGVVSAMLIQRVKI